MPTELRNEDVKLRQQIDYDDAGTEGLQSPLAARLPPRWLPSLTSSLLRSGLKTHIDDEYARAGIDDPKILITTSRGPSGRLTQFAKATSLVFQLLP